MRILLGCRKIIGLGIFACMVIFVLSLFGGNSTPSSALPTVALLPSLTWTPEAVAIVATDTPGVTIIPTEIRALSGLVTITPAEKTVSTTATITDTPLPTATNTAEVSQNPSPVPGSLFDRIQIGGTLAVPLSASFTQIAGIQSVDISVVPDKNLFLVTGSAQVTKGTDMLLTATTMRDNSYKVLKSAFIEFSIILDNGTKAVDYTWSNITDKWLISPLTITSVPISAPLLSVQSISSTTYYLIHTANVRSCASSTCNKLGQVTAGTSMAVSGVADGEAVTPGNAKWYQVEYGGTLAFIYSAYLTDVAPVKVQPPVIVQQPLSPVVAPVSPITNASCPDITANCSALSCQQAYACLGAGNGSLDRDHDGIPCESVCSS